MTWAKFGRAKTKRYKTERSFDTLNIDGEGTLGVGLILTGVVLIPRPPMRDATNHVPRCVPFPVLVLSSMCQLRCIGGIGGIGLQTSEKDRGTSGGRSGGGSSGAPSDVSDEAATSATPANIDRRKLLRDAIELDDLRLKKPRKHRQLTFTQQVS